MKKFRLFGAGAVAVGAMAGVAAFTLPFLGVVLTVEFHASLGQTGVILALFIVFHLLHLTVGVIQPVAFSETERGSKSWIKPAKVSRVLLKISG